MGEVDFSAKDSDYAKNHIANLKKMGYNQYRSTKVAFEYSDVTTGTQRMLYNPQKNQFEVWEKGDDTIIPMGIAKSGKEAERLYERIYGRYDSSFYGTLESIESTKGNDIWNSKLSENGRNDVGNGGKAQSERREYNTGRSGENLLEGNSGKSINNEPSSNDGGFSMPKFSTKDSNGKELTKEQQEYFKDSKVRDENEKTRNRPLSSSKKITEATDTIQGNSQVSRQDASVTNDTTTPTIESQVSKSTKDNPSDVAIYFVRL